MNSKTMLLIKNAIKQADDQADRAAGDLRRRQPFHRALRLALSSPSKSACASGASSAPMIAPTTGETNQKSELQRLAREVRREQVEVRFAAQQEARHAENDDERDAQDRLR